MNKNVFLFLISLIISLLFFEFVLRKTEIYKHFSEKNGGKYLSLFDVEVDDHFYRHFSNKGIHTYSSSEFEYTFEIDELGFRNRIGKIKEKPSICFLGDSFTEGLGADDLNTCPSVFETLVEEKVYNAGVIGSDIIYQQKILFDLLNIDSFEKIIFIINYSDIHDIITRGGKERFNSDGSISYKTPPLFMSFYRKSHLFRAIIHNVFRYDYMFNHPFNREENIQKALITISQTFEEIQDFCDKKNIEMSVFIHPLPQEYYKTLDSRLDFKEIDKLHNLLKNKNIEVYNLREDFEKRLHTKEDWKNHSWEIDGHFNEKGYGLMAKLIYEKIYLK